MTLIKKPEIKKPIKEDPHDYDDEEGEGEEEE
jgi:hypothetical protein